MQSRATYLLLVSILAITGCASDEVPEDTSYTIGDLAPEVTGVTYLQGSPVDRASDHNAYLIEFWATWCAPCKDSAPILSGFQTEYKNRGLLVAGLSDETESVVKPYLAEYGANMAYTIGLDPMGAVQKQFLEGYGISGVPWAFLLDGDGKVVWVGHPMAPELVEELATLLPNS
ncbi:MAG: TlpA disulfide reductase family protein [Candidatus Hydrogenedentota bacterium]